MTDVLTSNEPRVFQAVGHAYGLGGAASALELKQITEAWRPFRSWVSVLLVSRFMRVANDALPRPQGSRYRNFSASATSSLLPM